MDAHTTATYVTRLWQQHIVISVSKSLSPSENEVWCWFLSLQLYFFNVYRKESKEISRAARKRGVQRRGFQVGKPASHRSVCTHHNQRSACEFRLWVQICPAACVLCDFGQVTEPLWSQFPHLENGQCQQYLALQPVMKIKYCLVQAAALKVQSTEQNYPSPHRQIPPSHAAVLLLLV